MLKDLKLPIFICGAVASGKSSLAKSIANQLKYKIIEVSDITKTDIDPIEQEDIIIDELKAFLKKHNNKVIVCGVKQVRVLEAFEKGKLEMFPMYYWMDVPKEERLRRYLNQVDGSFTQHSFNKITAQDIQLGIKEVENYIKDYRNQINAEIEKLNTK